MNDSGVSIDAFLRSAELHQTNKWLAVPSVTVLVYDYLQTLDLEVGFIWKAKWSLGKIIFLLARYPSFVVSGAFIYYITAPEISPKMCYKLFCFVNLAGAFVVAVAEVILIMRTFALSGNNRWVLGVVLIVYAGGVISAFFLVASVAISIKYGISPLPTLRQCSPIVVNPLGVASFGLVLGFEVFIFLVTLVIGILRFRHTQSRLVVSLYTDGIFNFIYIVSVSLVNIIIQAAGPFELIEAISAFQIVMHSVLACRILLHVRRDAASPSCEREYEPDSVALAPIQFNGRESTRMQGTMNRTGDIDNSVVAG